MSGPLALVACQNHADREAIGICVKCKKRVCGECTTKVDGINHCVACFDALVAETAREAPRARTEGAVAAFVWAAIGLTVAVGAAWVVLELGLPGAG